MPVVTPPPDTPITNVDEPKEDRQDETSVEVGVGSLRKTISKGLCVCVFTSVPKSNVFKKQGAEGSQLWPLPTKLHTADQENVPASWHDLDAAA